MQASQSEEFSHLIKPIKVVLAKTADGIIDQLCTWQKLMDQANQCKDSNVDIIARISQHLVMEDQSHCRNLAAA